MDDSWNDDPLSPGNDALFWQIWTWLCDRGITDKNPPQVMSAELSAHDGYGTIYIDETHQNKDFPLGAVMLEEQLHYVMSSNDPNTSADFASEFLHRILDIIIISELKDKPDEWKRGFQSVLIGYLSKLIESDTRPRQPEPDAN